jgi:ECF sigma factor
LGDPIGIEVEIRGGAKGGWVFYDIATGTNTAKPLAKSMACYSCHAEHAAVDNTFVQFYPALIETAKRKATYHGSLTMKILTYVAPLVVALAFIGWPAWSGGDESLQELTELDALLASVVALRYFGGLENAEIAEVLEVSEATVLRDWRAARAWLFARLHPSERG